MSLNKRLHDLWLKAQGVPAQDISQGIWKAGTFIVNPPHCVLCGRAWRPDKPPYISIFGRTREAQVLEHWSEWYSPALDIAATTGLAPDQVQVRRLCMEHADRWHKVMDCVTGENIWLLWPPSRLQRTWRDARYWTISALRFVWLLAESVWIERLPKCRIIE